MHLKNIQIYMYNIILMLYEYISLMVYINKIDNLQNFSFTKPFIPFPFTICKVFFFILDKISVIIH